MPSDKKQHKSILFIVPYPYDTAPGQRFRFEQYLALLEESGFEYTYTSFLDNKTNSILYKKGFFITKLVGVVNGFFKRLFILFTLNKYNFVFIFREATPIGPPVFEWLIAKVFRKTIIYDFDDAIWLSNTSDVNRVIASVKWHHKVGLICKWAYKVSCGNAYLGEYAKDFNPNVIINPTTIDTEGLHKFLKADSSAVLSSANASKKIVIGWTGTHSTLQYLNVLVPVLERLEKKYGFDFHVISNKAPDFLLKSLKYKPWNKITEIDDLLEFDIGLMPLTDDIWANGKCGFKALQYMALGIPALASPVGVNTTIIDDGINGYLCKSEVEWESSISKLIEDTLLRIEMGKAARKKVDEYYSVRSNTTNFLSLFE